jgi:hypothetical protein
VSLVTSDDLTELWWCAQDTSRAFEDLQFALGEGPGTDAARTGAMVWVPDLAVRAVFCFPMGIGAIRVGALTAVRHPPGPLTPAQADDALVLASALTARCLGRDSPHLGVLDLNDPLCTLQHAVVHQATGMLSVPLSQALLRLRAHAYSSGRTITVTSQDVVDRRLHLNPNGNSDGTPAPVADKD